jgi:adenylate kinase
MRVALTGTPGTGKSAVAAVLRQYGYPVVQLHTLAVRIGCVDGIDGRRNTKLVNIACLDTYITKTFSSVECVFFEGHIAHLLRAMDKVIILRCHPRVLRKRLEKKKWRKQKIQENVEAETLDVILSETAQRYHTENIFEIDTTYKSVEEVAAIIGTIVKKNFQPIKKYRLGQIDWSEEILKGTPA